ncbi:hypothetical+protein [Methylocapsa aurea]|uniref:hypothetical protein n=1 Tax=Methylocapsa aurea TaxID=663610 RepID=UPI003D18ABC8
MIYRRLAFAGALVCALALVSPPAVADPLGDFFAALFAPQREARLHPPSVGWRRTRAAPVLLDGAATPLIAVAQRYVGSRNFTGLHAPWCMASLRVWLARAGYEAPRSNRAIDGLRIGIASAPRVGAVAVMPHHIGVVVAFTRRGPLILSGNHGGRVGYGVYSPRRILAYRLPV